MIFSILSNTCRCSSFCFWWLKKGKEFPKHHGESCYTQAATNNVNKLSDINFT